MCATILSDEETFALFKQAVATKALWRHVGLQSLLLHSDLWSFGRQEGPFSLHGTVARPCVSC